jgi:peroxiredoxin Q/BCP
MSATSTLKAGMQAPAFLTETWDGQPVSLAQFAGKRVWLAFFRHVNCPLCNIRIHEMRDRYNQSSSDSLQIVGIFQSPAARFQGAKMVGQTWYPLVSDPKEELYALYGLGSSVAGTLNPANLPLFAQAFASNMGSFTKIDGTVTRIPADFLIGPDGVIVDAFYGRKIGDHVPFARVEAFLKSSAAA